MSPLKICLLLRMYALPRPNVDLPRRQVHAPAMIEAINTFIRLGLIHPGTTARMLEDGTVPFDGILAPGKYLTEKGMDLVNRLLEVEP